MQTALAAFYLEAVARCNERVTVHAKHRLQVLFEANLRGKRWECERRREGGQAGAVCGGRGGADGELQLGDGKKAADGAAPDK